MTTSSRRALVVSQTSVTPFGRKLVQLGIADNAQIQAAFKTYRETGRDLVSVVAELTGHELTPRTPAPVQAPRALRAEDYLWAPFTRHCSRSGRSEASAGVAGNAIAG